MVPANTKDARKQLAPSSDDDSGESGVEAGRNERVGPVFPSVRNEERARDRDSGPQTEEESDTGEEEEDSELDYYMDLVADPSSGDSTESDEMSEQDDGDELERGCDDDDGKIIDKDDEQVENNNVILKVQKPKSEMSSAELDQHIGLLSNLEWELRSEGAKLEDEQQLQKNREDVAKVQQELLEYIGTRDMMVQSENANSLLDASLGLKMERHILRSPLTTFKKAELTKRNFLIKYSHVQAGMKEEGGIIPQNSLTALVGGTKGQELQENPEMPAALDDAGTAKEEQQRQAPEPQPTAAAPPLALKASEGEVGEKNGREPDFGNNPDAPLSKKAKLVNRGESALETAWRKNERKGDSTRHTPMSDKDNNMINVVMMPI